MTEDFRSLLVNIGDVLTALRQGAGLSQREAADKAESTQACVSYMEAGKKDFKLSTLQKMAAAYGLELEINFIRPQSEFDKTLQELFKETQNG